VIQLLHRIVHPTESTPESTIDRVALQQHDEIKPATHSAQHASAAHVDIEGLAKAPDSGPMWALRQACAMTHIWTATQAAVGVVGTH
jgi:hypothetical protein